MPSRFVKDTNACEFIHRERGPQDWPALTVEVRNSYNEEFGRMLMSVLPRGSWMYDRDAAPRCFRIMPERLDQAIELARAHYPHVYVTDGTRIENVVTGEVYEEQRLF